MRTKNILNFILLIIFIIFLGGCGSEDILNQTDNLDFSVQSKTDTLADNSILLIDTAKILIKDIKLNPLNNNNDTTNFKVGPFVLYLNFDARVTKVTSGMIPIGSYDKIRFMIHKLENNEPVPDPDFADSNGRYSAVVKGRYNGIPFVFKSDKSAHQKLNMLNVLIVRSTGTTNVTLRVQPYIWFIKNGVYLDPNDPANKSDIENNIKDNINQNIKAFTDNNRDGEPDL
jgi:hypothetical protein